MGQLKPDATYIYERANGVTYAREIGSSPEDRIVIGYDVGAEHLALKEKLADEMLWEEIHAVSKHNPAIQDALDRVKELYLLMKEHK